MKFLALALTAVVGFSEAKKINNAELNRRMQAGLVDRPTLMSGAKPYNAEAKRKLDEEEEAFEITREAQESARKIKLQATAQAAQAVQAAQEQQQKKEELKRFNISRNNNNINNNNNNNNSNSNSNNNNNNNNNNNKGSS